MPALSRLAPFQKTDANPLRTGYSDGCGVSCFTDQVLQVLSCLIFNRLSPLISIP